MTRRKKEPGTGVPQDVVLFIAGRLKQSRKHYDTQEELAAWVGVKQSTVSRFLSAVHDDPKKRKPYYPGADVVAVVARRYGLRLEDLLAGKLSTGKWEALDVVLPNRGRALDILSGEYSPELLAALRRHVPQEDHAEWSEVKWLEYFVTVKKAWETGVLELPGLKR